MDAETGSPGTPPADRDPNARRAELNLLLARFYLDMRRGMEEFLRVYGMPPAESSFQDVESQELVRRLVSAPDGDATWRDLEAGIQELKVHHAALLEGYHQATGDGARKILETVDPEVLRREFEGSSIRVGPLKLSAAWQPVLVQAIWEEMLRRFGKYRALEPADYERYFRDGFRGGYRRFSEGRRPRPAAQAGGEA